MVIKVEEVATGIYDFQYPFQIWQNWFQKTNLVLRCVCTFDQVLDTGETVTFSNTFDSPDFNLGNYDETKNTASEPQALRKDPSIYYEDTITSNQLSSIKNSGTTRVIAVFEDNNLSNLDVEPHTWPYVYDTPVIDGLTGFLSINVGTKSQPTWLRFHTTRSNPTEVDGNPNPWKIISGQPTYNSKLTRNDVKTATIEAIIDAEELKGVYGGDFKCLDVTGRLDAYRIPLYCWIWETDFEVTNPSVPPFNPTFDSPVDWIFAEESEILNANGPNITDRSTPISLDADELDGLDQIVKCCNFDPSTITTLSFVNQNIRNDFDLTDFIALTSINVSQNSTAFSVVFPMHAVPTTVIDTATCPQLTSLDFSGLSALAGTVNSPACTSLTTVNFGTSDEVITDLNFNGCTSLTSADLSGYTAISSQIEFTNCTSLVTLVLGSSSEIIDDLLLVNTDLTSLDISGLERLSGNFMASGISGLTTLTTAAVDNTDTFTKWHLFNCDLTGELDLSHYLKLGGQILMENNNNLTNVIWPSSSTVITDFRIMSSAITTLDLSNLTGLGGDVRASSTSSLEEVLLPTSSETFTELYFQLCSLEAFDITPLTGSNDGIDIDLSNNNIDTTELEDILSDCVDSGWDNGELNLTSNAGLVSGGTSNADYVILTDPPRNWIVSIDV
jgi:hypothetical protein